MINKGSFVKVSSFFTWVYRILLKNCNNKYFSKTVLRVRKYVSKIFDPIVRVHVNGQSIICPFSHMLPFYQECYNNYDRQLEKICAYIEKKLKRRGIFIIDVGANIGDTVININSKDSNYLLIEGEQKFGSLINENLKGFSFNLEQCYLSEVIGEEPYISQTNSGTAKLVKTNQRKDNKTIQVTTLDALVKKTYPDFVPNIIKVDTDGFDFKVIRGGYETIKNTKPAIFFEWDSLLLKEQGENEGAIFPYLYELGYKKALIYDNFGEMLCIIKTDDTTNIKVLIDYLDISNKRIFYYDVLLFHEESICKLEELV